MSETQTFRLAPMTKARRLAVEAVNSAPDWWTVKVGPETRSDKQNRLLHPLLAEVSKQCVWHGRTIPPLEWKNGFVMAMKHAEFVPGIEPGTIWPLGLSTRVMNKTEFGNLLECIYAFSAQHAIVHRGQRVG